jgi:hypothetical protein
MLLFSVIKIACGFEPIMPELKKVVASGFQVADGQNLG